jgi:putative hydroxymethylpyrimidine transport system ATP-binding protein
LAERTAKAADPLNLIWVKLAEEEVVPPSISIKQAQLVFDKKLIFHDVTLTVPAGKWVALLGKSGVGKSSLLRMMAGLLPSTHITVDNHIPISHQTAYMAQTDLLLPWYNVLKNVMLGSSLRAESFELQREKRQQALLLLKKVGLDQAIHLYPQALSGGMRQRVALVRTLMEDKPIVLMDEPFSALDAITRHQLQALAVRLLKNKTVLFITHDPQEALRLADDIYILKPNGAEHIVSLSTETPRELNHPDLLQYQSYLFQKLEN